MKKDKILVVDDSSTNIKILSETLQDDYDIVFAMTGLKAIEVAQTNHPDLILLDVMMPEMDGYEVCSLLKADPKTAHIPIIFITAMSGEQDETKGFTCGAVDYVTKPIKPVIVQSRVRTHLELKSHRDHLEELVAQRTDELLKTQKEIVQRLGRAAEYRDNETGLHILRLGHFCSILGRELGMSKIEQENFRYASTMHDVGKIGIPDSILLKPAKLDPDEWEIMKTHPEIGADLLSGSDSKLLELAQIIALTHHEKWDGSGYPRGLKGEQIPLVGRIIAVCDVFDALTSVRPYKKAWTVEDTMAHINDGRNQHFDPSVVDLFVSLLPEIIALKDEFQD